MYKTNIIKLILDMEAFMTKKGNNIEVKNKLIQSINIFTKCDFLKSIYINENDSYMVPDVYVMPMYSKSIGHYLVNSDTSQLYEGPYTIEIHQRCFSKYSAEELTALIIHDILQNILSNTAKTRFLMAYTSAIDKHKDSEVMDVFDSMTYSEIAYMIYMDICMRPFNLPITNNTMAASDEVLSSYGIDDAYESAAFKNAKDKYTSLDNIVKDQVKMDNQTADTIVKACIRGEILYYYSIFKNNFPMITITNVMSINKSNVSLGFTESSTSAKSTNINESLFKPTSETELQFQIDKIVTSMRYAENEDERASLLFKIKTLKLKLISMKKDLSKESSKPAADEKYYREKMGYIDNYISELDELRVEVVKMEIVPKRYGVFIKYPEGYDY